MKAIVMLMTPFIAQPLFVEKKLTSLVDNGVEGSMLIKGHSFDAVIVPDEGDEYPEDFKKNSRHVDEVIKWEGHTTLYVIGLDETGKPINDLSFLNEQSVANFEKANSLEKYTVTHLCHENGKWVHKPFNDETST